jgi:MFS family permease
VAYFAVRDLIPLYAVYALLFSDNGLSTAEISSLLVIWSVTAFVLEVPTGAWADAVSRRALLVLSSLLYAVGFSLWVAVPSYGAFAAGFVLWGASGALMSGTFQALLYDELAACNAASHYARLMGWANSLAMVATLVGTALATPLFVVGGYTLVGWVSVGVALVQALLALSLPAAPRAVEADDSDLDESPDMTGGLVSRYVVMLQSGLSEIKRHRLVRHAVLMVSMLGLLAFDEYFPLVARDNGASTETVPLMVALTVAGPAIGTALAGRSARMGGGTMAWALAAAAILTAYRRHGGPVARLRGDRHRLRHRRQRDDRGRGPSARCDHRTRPSDRHVGLRPVQRGLRAGGVRGVRARLGVGCCVDDGRGTERPDPADRDARPAVAALVPMSCCTRHRLRDHAATASLSILRTRLRAQVGCCG